MAGGSWNITPGINHVGAYQVSGAPFATASVDAFHGHRPGGHKIQFPYLTKWFKVINKDAANDCKVAFSLSGMTGSNNFFTIGKADADGNVPGLAAMSEVLDLKVGEIWISGSTDVDIVAGLTSISTDRARTDSGTSWSGSSGVG
jgi:hypothetical protein